MVASGLREISTPVTSDGYNPVPVMVNSSPPKTVVGVTLVTTGAGKAICLFRRLDVDGQRFRAPDDDFVTLLDFV